MKIVREKKKEKQALQKRNETYKIEKCTLKNMKNVSQIKI